MKIEEELKSAKRRLSQLEELNRVREKLVVAELKLLGTTEEMVICEIVCAYYRRGILELKVKSRRSPDLWMRYTAMHLIRKHTGMAYAQIAHYFEPAVKDHTTVMNAVRQVKDRLNYDRKFRGELEELDRIIERNRDKAKSNFAKVTFPPAGFVVRN